MVLFLLIILDFSRFVKHFLQKFLGCAVVQLFFVHSEISRFALALVRRRIRRQVHFCLYSSAVSRQVQPKNFPIFEECTEFQDFFGVGSKVLCAEPEGLLWSCVYLG